LRLPQIIRRTVSIAQVPRCLYTLGTSSGECCRTAPTIGR
jgi:hypothetical protein